MKTLRNWRKMTWVVIGWCTLILAWAIGGASSGASKNAADCAHSAYLTAQDCLAASNTGTGIGVAIILLVGFFGFVFFSLIWFMTRPRQPRAA